MDDGLHDEGLRKMIHWKQDDDRDLAGDCLHGIMDDCMEVMNYDLSSDIQKDHLIKNCCVPCLILYNANSLDEIQKTLEKIETRLKKLEKVR